MNKYTNFLYFSFFWLFIKFQLVFKGFKFPKEISICCFNVEGYTIIHQQKKTPPLYVITYNCLSKSAAASVKWPWNALYQYHHGHRQPNADHLEKVKGVREPSLSSPLFSQRFVNIKSSYKEDMICLCVLSVRGDLWRNFRACLRINWVYNLQQPWQLIVLLDDFNIPL